MSNYANPSSFLDGLGLRPEIEAPAAVDRDREELIEILGQVNSVGNWTVDGKIADAILAAGFRKQKP